MIAQPGESAVPEISAPCMAAHGSAPLTPEYLARNERATALPRQAPEGLYDFAISVHTQEDGNNQLRYYLDS
jgi:hypothetical protein